MDVLYLFGAFTAGWLVAQLCKLIAGMVKKKGKVKFSDIVYFFSKSGGMPSGHTASFVALCTEIALIYGVNNPTFAVAACTTLIFIYDAVNVRYAVGEHGRLLNMLAENDNDPKTKPQKIVEGHTVPQVIVGALVGIALGWLVYLLYQANFLGFLGNF